MTHSPGNRTMTFGQHKGKALKDIPRDYLAWALDNANGQMSAALLADVKAILKADADASQHASPTPTADAFDAARAAVRRVYGLLSKRHHPDHGGSNAKQAVVGEFYETALAEIDKAAQSRADRRADA